MARVDIERGASAAVALDSDGPSSHPTGTKPNGYWELQGEVSTGETSYDPGIWGQSFTFNASTHPDLCTVEVPGNAPLGELDIVHHGGVAPSDPGVMHQHIFLIKIVCGEPELPDVPVIADVQTTSIAIVTPELPECADELRVEWSLAGQGNWQDAGNHPAQTLVDITGLTAGQAYDLRVVAINATHSGGTPSDVVTEFTLCEAPVISGVVINVILTWQAVNGAIRYIVKRNNAVLDTTEDTTYTDILQAGADNDYTVTAVNGANVQSAESDVVTVAVRIAMIPP